MFTVEREKRRNLKYVLGLKIALPATTTRIEGIWRRHKIRRPMGQRRAAAGGGGRQMYLLIGRKACRQGDACGKPSPNESEPVNMETVIFIVQYCTWWGYTGPTLAAAKLYYMLYVKNVICHSVKNKIIEFVILNSDISQVSKELHATEAWIWFFFKGEKWESMKE